MAIAKKTKAKAADKAAAQARANDEAQQIRKVEEPQPASRLDGPRTIDGDPYFSRADMFELMLTQERVKHAETKVGKAKADLGKHEAAYMYQRMRLGEQTTAANVELANERARLFELHAEIERTYSMSLKAITFDPDTGKINTAATH